MAGWQSWVGLDAAKTFRELSTYQLQVSREDLRVSLTRAYYGTILAQEGLRVAKEALEQTEKHLARVKELHQQGVASEYDLIRARVAVSNQRPAVSQAEAGADLAMKGLKHQIGLNMDQVVKLTGELNAAVSAPELSYEEASDFAMQQRVELRQLALQEELYRIEYKVNQRSWLWPNFLAGLRWETSAQSQDLKIGKYEFLGGFGGQLILQIPLFDGFSSHYRAQQSKLDMRNTRLQRSMLKRGIEMEVFDALRSFQRSQEELDAAVESLQQAEKGYSIAQTRYDGGVGTQLEVLDAQLQLNMSKVNLLQAEYNLLMAKVNYDRASGKRFGQPSSLGDNS
jgi:outer membrane protein TolC